MRTTRLFIYPETQVTPTNLDLGSGNTTGWTMTPAGIFQYDTGALESTSATSYAQASLNTNLYIPGSTYRVEYRIDGATSTMSHYVYLNSAVSKTSYGNGMFSVDVICKNRLTRSGKVEKELARFAIVLNNGVNKDVRISSIKTYEVKETEIDLTDNMSIPMTFLLQNLTDISKRESNRSATIKLPGSPLNNITFKHVYQVAAADSFRLNYGVRARYLDNDIELFSGFLYMKQINVTNADNYYEYECDLRSEVNTLFKITSEKLLRGNVEAQNNLDFSEYDHIKNFNNVHTSWWKGSNIRTGTITPGWIPTQPTYAANHNTSTVGTGYVYPLINYGQSTTDVKMTEMRPALFMYEVLKKIVNSAGYTFTSTFLESDFFKRMIYPRTTKVTDAEAAMSDTTYVNNGIVSAYLSPGSYGENRFVKHDRNSLNGVNYAAATTVNLNYDQGYNDGIYRILYDGSYNFNFNINTSKLIFFYKTTADDVVHLETNGGQTPEGWSKCGYLSFELIRNRNGVYKTIGVPININKADFDSSDVPVGDHILTDLGSPNVRNGVGPGNISWTDTESLAGDTYKVQVSLYSAHVKGGYEHTGQYNQDERKYNWNTSGNRPVYVYYEVPANSCTMKVTRSSVNAIGENATARLNYTLHDGVKQSDLLMSIIKTFNLMVDIDPENSRNLIIEPYDNYYATGVSYDWSQKRDPKVFTIDEASDLNRKNLTFKWTDDTDFYNTSYKAGVPTREYGDNQIKSETQSNVTNIIQPGFAPSPMDKFVSTQNANNIIVPILCNKPDESGKFDQNITLKPRILYWDGLQYWHTPPQGIPPAASWKLKLISGDKTFGTNYLTRFYPYAGHVDKPLRNEATFNLNFGTNAWYWYTDSSTMTYKNLVNNYYSNMLAEFADKDSKKITAYFNLTNEDIYNFRFYNKIIIEEQGIKTYYRVSKITDYVPGKVTKVELYKLTTQPVPVSYNRWNWVNNLTTLPNATPYEMGGTGTVSTMSTLPSTIITMPGIVETDTAILNKPLQYYTNLITGGVDTTNENFSHSTIEMITGGVDDLRGYGSTTEINKIDGTVYSNPLTNVIEEQPVSETMAAALVGPQGFSGYSGYSGTNGTVGVNGASGYSGYSGQAGTSGYSGYSGVSLSLVNTTSSLPASGWSGNSQVIGVSGVTTTNDIFWDASTLSDNILAGQANLFCSTQATNALTFVCSTAPTSNININITII